MSPSQETLKDFQCTPGNSRGFCTNCGTFFYWKCDDGQDVSLAAGTVDPLYLFGEGADGDVVPKHGFGNVLIQGSAHEWTANEIPGVTDRMELLFRGRREKESAD